VTVSAVQTIGTLNSLTTVSAVQTIGTLNSLTTLTTVSNLQQIAGVTPLYIGQASGVSLGAGIQAMGGTAWNGTNYENITTQGTTTTGKYGWDTNILSVLGTAPTTAGYLNVIAAQSSASLLQVTAIPNSNTGSSVPAGAFYNGFQAVSTEIATPASAGNLAGGVTDLTGKQIIMPYANKENFLSGLGNTSTTNYQLVMASQASGYKTYITSLQLSNTGASNTLFTLNNGSLITTSNALWQGIIPSGGGSNVEFIIPIMTSASNGLIGYLGTATANAYWNAQGYKGS